MRDGNDLKETILRRANELFEAQGYAGTSIKQIAGASGCTSAALYYYFAEGKAQILREVVHSTFSQKFTALLQAGQDAASLGEWVRTFGNAAIQSLHGIQRSQTWIELELHQLGADEQAAIRQQMLDLHRAITIEIARFVGDTAMADKLAWILPCLFVGYGQMFLSRKLDQVAEFDPATFVETVAALIGKAAE
jgi:AcrR family transcriptional regulator